MDSAHRLGLGVILDVVYNHLGPDGNYLKLFAPQYFSSRYKNEWGEPLNFDGEESGPVREFFISNALYWIDEFHLDGFRFDATQQIYDASPVHILVEIVAGARVRASEVGRQLWMVAENEPQEARVIHARSRGGWGLNAVWNDDFHHSLRVSLTGRREAYYTDYRGTPQELLSALKWGFLYQGQWYHWQGQRRGTPALDASADHFVHFLENHDQVANTGDGRRLVELSGPGRYRALTALILLGPGTPMLFQGQEQGTTTPFLYFADHPGTLAADVARGRKDFLRQFPSLAEIAETGIPPPPGEEETFTRCKLRGVVDEQVPMYRLHRDLLALRREDERIRNVRRGNFDGAVLGSEALVVRYFSMDFQDDRLLVVNLGCDLSLEPVAEPLLAPASGTRWEIVWHSEAPGYGGSGLGEVVEDGRWRLPGRAAVLLGPAPA